MESALKTSKKSARPSVFGYHDHAEFLKHWFSYKKTTDKRFSLRRFASACAVSQSYLSFVLSKKIPLSEKAFLKIAPHLGLKTSEVEYLNELRAMSSTNSASEKAASLAKIHRFSDYKKRNIREVDLSRYLTNWYNIVIKEMSTIPGFQPDAKWIRDKLNKKVSLEDIQNALDFLEKKKLLGNKSEEHASKDLFQCENEVLKIALSKYHADIFSLAEHSIFNTKSEKRQIDALTVRISSSKFERAKEIIQKALAQIGSLDSDEPGADSVYLMSTALFPVAQMGEDDQGEGHE